MTFFIKTTKALQTQIFQTVGYRKNLLIETVSRVQGLTTDVCIFIIPNSSYHRSLENRLFNVATSRSRGHTIIIADQNILDRAEKVDIDKEVIKFLERLNDEFSFYLKFDHDRRMLEN